jgi:hypothetical protein
MKVAAVGQVSMERQASAMSDPSPLVRDKANPFGVLRVRIEVQKAQNNSDGYHREA